MQHAKLITKVFREISKLVIDESEQNPRFAERLEKILEPLSSTASRKHKEPVNVPDIFAERKQRDDGSFASWLFEKEIPILKAIIRKYQFDPSKRSAKWTDARKLADLIFQQVDSHLKRGSAFMSTDE
ncbi:MAG TPA: hypothetical protein VHY30_09305 [Verrucomicrobiae bacterium]|jgi:hypothetical protein|nr:hypothetical protein [Verrucomicrobiae bacterium]